MKKRAFATALAICMFFSLSACGGPARDSAETVVKNAIDAVKSYNPTEADEYWGDGTILEGNESADEEMLKAIFAGISYEIVGSEEKESTATVDVTISNVDMSQVVSDTLTEVLPVLFADAFQEESEQMSEEESNQLFRDTLTQMLQRTENTRAENTVTVTLSLIDGEWVIDDGNDAAIDAMLGGISSLADAMEEAFTEEDAAIETSSDFDSAAVLSQLEVKELTYSTGYSNYAFLVIQNDSDYDLSIYANVTFYNESGDLVGAKSDSLDAVESGYDSILYFMPDEEFATMEYELDVDEETWYECVRSDLSYEGTIAKDKVILSVTNNGEEAAEFVEASVLFFNGDTLVGFDQNYMGDDDSELKPGKTISKEMNCYEEFDSYQVFLSGIRYT